MKNLPNSPRPGSLRSLGRSVFPILLLASPLGCQRQQAQSAYRLLPAFPGQARFERPLLLEHTKADPGHYYVVCQDGKIFRIPSDASSKSRSVFFDGTGKILGPSNGGHNEEGLLGFAFDPDYAKNAFVYVYYSKRVDRNGRKSVIARFKVDRAEGAERDGEGGDTQKGAEASRKAPVCKPDSELVLLEIPQPWGNHNGGTIVFGHDGMLYVALGDGGAGGDPKGNGQKLSTLLASVLRIDVRGASKEARYAVPKDNPFALKKGARPEIWAYGLRNPWRISFDRKTGELWCGDVGQNRWEEVDRIVRGGNYGWRLLEGTHPYDRRALKSLGDEAKKAFLAPVAEYDRSQGFSITGGYVYRGKALPELDGMFVYGDFGTGKLWAVREDRKNGKHEVRLLLRGASLLASFAEEPDGELLVLRFDGRIYRLARAEEEKGESRKGG